MPALKPQQSYGVYFILFASSRSSIVIVVWCRALFGVAFTSNLLICHRFSYRKCMSEPLQLAFHSSL